MCRRDAPWQARGRFWFAFLLLAATVSARAQADETPRWCLTPRVGLVVPEADDLLGARVIPSLAVTCDLNSHASLVVFSGYVEAEPDAIPHLLQPDGNAASWVRGALLEETVGLLVNGIGLRYSPSSPNRRAPRPYFEIGPTFSWLRHFERGYALDSQLQLYGYYEDVYDHFVPGFQTSAFVASPLDTRLDLEMGVSYQNSADAEDVRRLRGLNGFEILIGFSVHL